MWLSDIIATIPIDKVTVMRNGTLNTYDTSIPEERNRLILETDLTDKGISQCHQASRHFNPKNPHKVVVMSTLDRTNQTAATVMGARDPLTGLPISDWAGGPRVAVWDVNGQLTLAYKRDVSFTDSGGPELMSLAGLLRGGQMYSK